MTEITFSYLKNAKGKYTFKLIQDGAVFFEKDYSPNLERNQHLLGEAITQVFNQDIQSELEANPDFKWTSFEDAKSWMSVPSRLDKGVQLKNELMGNTI